MYQPRHGTIYSPVGVCVCARRQGDGGGGGGGGGSSSSSSSRGAEGADGSRADVTERYRRCREREAYVCVSVLVLTLV